MITISRSVQATVAARSCFKNKIRTKGLGGHSSRGRESSCLACVRPWVRSPVLQEEKKKKKRECYGFFSPQEVFKSRSNLP
jgi:hypothetical protein